MKNLLFAAVLLLIWPVSMFSQTEYKPICTNIQGVVIDNATGHPIPFANIQVSSGKHQQTSLDSGKFNIIIPFGFSEGLLEVSCPGYQSQKFIILNSIINHEFQKVQLEPLIAKKISSKKETELLNIFLKELSNYPKSIHYQEQGIWRMTHNQQRYSTMAAISDRISGQTNIALYLKNCRPQLPTEWPQILRQANETWPELISCDIFSNPYSPLSTDKQQYYQFNVEGLFGDNLKVSFSCSNPSFDITNINGLKNLQGEFWFNIKTYDLISFSSIAQFTDGHSTKKTALYARCQRAPLQAVLPITLNVSNITDSNTTTVEWHSIDIEDVNSPFMFYQPLEWENKHPSEPWTTKIWSDFWLE